MALRRKAKVVSREKLEPDAAGVLRAISRIGYRLPEAIADLVDNSVDAGAQTVLIRFLKDDDDLRALSIVDDGSGMTERGLEEAMRFGSRSEHQAGDLGKYGMGLKSASLNNADSLSVFTRRGKHLGGRRWTAASIAEGWRLETLDPSDAQGFLDQDWDHLTTRPSGTHILWEDLERFTKRAGLAGQRFGQYKRSIAAHLGLIFHRFIIAGRLKLVIDLQDRKSGVTGFEHVVEALDPFPEKSGHRGYPLGFHVPLGAYGELVLQAYIWPPLAGDPGYKLNGSVAQGQGLYFFRNDRLIQAGGWNGWRDDAEPHASLARAAIELPPSLDQAFAINVQKSGVDAPPGFLESLNSATAGSTTMADYIGTAVEVYRKAGVHEKPVATVGGGLRRKVREEINSQLATDGGKAVPVEIGWERLPKNRVFRVDNEQRQLTLNSRYRRELLGEDRATSGDAPFLKTALFLLLSGDAIKERLTRKAEVRLDAINACLLAAIEDELAR